MSRLIHHAWKDKKFNSIGKLIYAKGKRIQKSCGCITKKHGMWGGRLYRIWHDMGGRCNYISHKSYRYYGGRGIKVCDEWNDFIPFMDWALSHGYKENLTIDRIDNDKGYSPENCRWATRSEQELNKKKTGNEGILYLKKPRRWWSRIKRNGISTNLGYYKTKEEAINARKQYMLVNNIK